MSTNVLDALVIIGTHIMSGHSGNGVIAKTCVLLLVVGCLICMMKDGQMGEYGGYHLPSYISHIKHSLFPKNNLLPAL